MADRVCPHWVGYLLINPLRKLFENPNKILGPFVQEGMIVLEPGCGMGYFSLPLARMVGPKGRVVGIDVVRPDRLSASNFKFIQGDVLTTEVEGLFREIGPRDVVMSDLAPQTTGIRLADESRSILLARKAVEIAVGILKKRGDFVCKVFEGEDLRVFRAEASAHFRQMRSFRPKAVRKGSREVYLVGLGLVE